MIVKIDKRFSKDVHKIKDADLLHQISEVIIEAQNAIDYRTINNLKKLSGYKNYYRIKLGNYRIGVMIVSGTIEFIIFSNRKDIYKRFP